MNDSAFPLISTWVSASNDQTFLSDLAIHQDWQRFQKFASKIVEESYCGWLFVTSGEFESLGVILSGSGRMSLCEMRYEFAKDDSFDLRGDILKIRFIKKL